VHLLSRLEGMICFPQEWWSRNVTVLEFVRRAFCYTSGILVVLFGSEATDFCLFQVLARSSSCLAGY
jgi:hypothetical protein